MAQAMRQAQHPLAELLLDECGQAMRAVIGGAAEKGREVLAYDTVEHGVGCTSRRGDEGRIQERLADVRPAVR